MKQQKMGIQTLKESLILLKKAAHLLNIPQLEEVHNALNELMNCVKEIENE